MPTSEECEQKAAECLRLARVMSDLTRKALLLQMALAWTERANQVKNAERLTHVDAAHPARRLHCAVPANDGTAPFRLMPEIPPRNNAPRTTTPPSAAAQRDHVVGGLVTGERDHEPCPCLKRGARLVLIIVLLVDADDAGEASRAMVEHLLGHLQLDAE